MDLLAEKIELAKLLLNTDSPKIIESIKNIFLKAQETDFWEELSLEQQEEIKLATREMEMGKVSDYDEFITNHR